MQVEGTVEAKADDAVDEDMGGAKLGVAVGSFDGGVNRTEGRRLATGHGCHGWLGRAGCGIYRGSGGLLEVVGYGDEAAMVVGGTIEVEA